MNMLISFGSLTYKAEQTKGASYIVQIIPQAVSTLHNWHE